MQKLTTALVLCVLLAACAGTQTAHVQERPMNDGERTQVSPKVLAMVDDSGGKLDIREHKNVKCKRIKIVGTHIHKRICYTTQEEALLAKQTYDQYYRTFGHNKCLTPAVCSGN